jgi:hypothetical protein
MNASLRIGASRGLTALALAVLVLVGQTQTPKKNLVLFPFGLGDSVMQTKGYRLQDELSQSVRAGFEKSGGYVVVPFTRMHPSVKRALAEDTVKAAMLIEPFTGKSGGEFKAVALGKLLRGDFAAAGVVDEFSYSAAKKSAKIVVSLELYDVRKSKPCGGVVLTSTGAGDTEAAAAKDACAKMAESMVPQAVSIFNKPKPEG